MLHPKYEGSSPWCRSFFLFFLLLSMATSIDIIAMSESDLMKRKSSINKGELLQTILLMRKKSNDSISGDLSVVIERKLKEGLEPILSKLVHVSEELSQLRSSYSKLEQELCKCKAQNNDLMMNISAEVEQRTRRRNNIIVSGLNLTTSGTLEERNDSDEEKMENLLTQLSLSRLHIAETRRLGRPGQGTRSLLKVVFDSFEEKQEILQRARKLRELDNYKGVYINPDRTPLQQQQHKKLIQEMKTRTEAGEDVTIFRDKVVLRESLKNFHPRF